MKTRIGKLLESSGDTVHIFKAKDGKWYYLIDRRGSETFHGPFDSVETADQHLGKKYGNPGGYTIDRSGNKPAPASFSK